VHCHQQSGYQVIGLSLSAVAAENLSIEANVTAETIAFYLDKWIRLETAQERFWSLHPSHEHPELIRELNRLEPYQLTDQHLVIVDEAGMVGTSQWHNLLYFVQKSGAKCIAVGDDHQFKAIEAGDFFRKLKEILLERICQLNDIQRQKVNWMKEASVSLAELRTYEALANYENHHCIEPITDLKTIAQRYVDKCQQEPDRSGLLLASTNVQCDQLNTAVRIILKERGIIDHNEVYLNRNAFSINDRITFFSNDRLRKITTYDPVHGLKKDFLIKNGTKGCILAIEALDNTQSEFQVTVEINANTHAKFSTLDYDDFKQCYASTLFKAQGKTADWNYILVSKNMDAFATYVALTRHRYEVHVFYEAREFNDFKSLQASLGRVTHKDLIIDYTIAPENQIAWENVQEYKLLGQDLSATIQETNWEGYNALKLERNLLGKIILEEWNTHQPFARQAGLSFEAIAINCGLKMRPLSLAEITSRDTVNLYAEKALSARVLWRQIRETHPGRNCYQHERYAEFTQLRQERNALAKNIMENVALHKLFVQAAAKTQGIGWKTLSAQAKQEQEFKFYERSKQKQGFEVYERASIHNFGYASVTINQKVSACYEQPFNRVEPAQIKSELQQKMGLLAYSLLGEPNSKSAREWRYGNHGSIAIQVNGTKQGLYANFELGSYGGPLKFIQDQLNLDYKEAYKWAIDWLGHKSVERSYTEKPLQDKSVNDQKSLIPIYPVPEHKHNPDLIKEKSLSYVLTKQNQFEIERYPYLDAVGNLLGYTVRLENRQGDKVVLPLTYCQNAKGVQQWRWHGFGDDRPLYGLQRLAEYPDKAVLVVEGEKTANAAQQLFSEMVVVSWPGGSGAVAKVDWSPLMGKSITLWPDNDAAGYKAMERINQLLSSLNEEKNLNTKIHQVLLPLDTPLKWDLADKLPESWTQEKLTQLLNIPSKTQIELIFTKDYVKEVTQKYGIEGKHFNLDHYFISQTKQFYQQMVDWHQILEIPISSEKNQQLIEKSVLTQALVSAAKKEYCFGESHLSAQKFGEDLALVSAKLMQNNPDKRLAVVSWLDAAYKVLTKQQMVTENLIKDYQNTHKDVSSQQLQLMANQQHICQNYTGFPLNEKAQLKILEATKIFEELQKQGDIAKVVRTITQEQFPSSTKETTKTVGPLLERECIKQLIMKPENAQQNLENASKVVKDTQAELGKQLQKSIELMMRDLNLEKGKERER
jgi:hypothetical protein